MEERQRASRYISFGLHGRRPGGRRAIRLGMEVGQLRLVAWTTQLRTEISLCPFWSSLFSVSTGWWGRAEPHLPPRPSLCDGLCSDPFLDLSLSRALGIRHFPFAFPSEPAFLVLVRPLSRARAGLGCDGSRGAGSAALSLGGRRGGARRSWKARSRTARAVGGGAAWLLRGRLLGAGVGRSFMLLPAYRSGAPRRGRERPRSSPRCITKTEAFDRCSLSARFRPRFVSSLAS